MQARELVELAALVSLHGPSLIVSSAAIPPECLEQYWTLSKCRLDRWGLALNRFKTSTAGSTASRSQRAPLGAMEEILTGEVLTRVWAAVLSAHDRRHGRSEAEPIARSVLIGHLEVRHRVLNAIVHDARLEPEEAVWLNRLRRRARRWTDLLVANLLPVVDVSEFAMEPGRAKALCGALRPPQGPSWQVLLTSLRAAFRASSSVRSPNPDVNARIASNVLGCFEPELFESTGLFRSVWLARLLSATDDTQGMLDALFRADEGREVTPPAAPPAPQGVRQPGGDPAADDVPFKRRRF